ncbi:virulence factors putative positive transcription regulator BvgA [Pseudomonas laurentiana]|uniref:response regulator transcription factor n=1 Tax=Pseudomonas laurentiana TaxID=2364649 RepID=UPI0016775AAB|nr:response regulator transcription factor [Pseudomonas laurentiana]GGU51030.1 virulence factors putative positive transcription regulator BvgA [Pseudomonas laurentiana]
MAKVLIVDDHPTIRIGLKMLLEQHRYHVVGESGDGVESVQLIRELKPDVVVLDIGIPRLDGLSVLKRLRLLEPPPRILVYTGQPAELFSRRCLDAGASAFVHKEETEQSFLAALKAVVSGYAYFPDMSLRGPMASEGERLTDLSDQEMVVLRLLAAGRSNKDIAEEMMLSPKTISTYKTRIMEKLQVSSLVEMVDLANRNLT